MQSDSVYNAGALGERLRTLLPVGEAMAPEAGLFGVGSGNVLRQEPAFQRDVFEGGTGGETRWDAFTPEENAAMDGVVATGQQGLDLLIDAYTRKPGSP